MYPDFSITYYVAAILCIIVGLLHVIDEIHPKMAIVKHTTSTAIVALGLTYFTLSLCYRYKIDNHSVSTMPSNAVQVLENSCGETNPANLPMEARDPWGFP